MCALAVAVSVAGSTGIWSSAWAWRVDVPALAAFVAGCILVLFGRAEFHRQRATIVLLALAWPLPWALVFLHVLTPFTAATVAVVRGGLDLTHWARPAGGANTRFLMSGRSPYVIDVAPACSGIDGVVGFVLVSVAFGALVTGSRVRKALWLGAALVLLWVLNAIRILAIFGVAHVWGRDVAINWLHPYAGIVMFNIALVAMLALLGRFGLGLHLPDPDRAISEHPVRPYILTCLALAAIILVGATANAWMSRFDLASNESATQPRAFLDVATRALGTAEVHDAGQRNDAGAYFGEDASWTRYDLATGGAVVRADVIRTDSASALASFGTAAFMRSPATLLTSVERIDTGALHLQVWHLAGGRVDVVWIARVAAGSESASEQVVLSGADRRTLLRLAATLAGAP